MEQAISNRKSFPLKFTYKGAIWPNERMTKHLCPRIHTPKRRMCARDGRLNRSLQRWRSHSPKRKRRARAGCVIERGQKRGFFLLDRRTSSRGFLPCKSWLTRRKEAIWPSEIFVLKRIQHSNEVQCPNETRNELAQKESSTQSKDATKPTSKEPKFPIEGCKIKENLFFLQFCQKEHFHLFCLF